MITGLARGLPPARRAGGSARGRCTRSGRRRVCSPVDHRPARLRRARAPPRRDLAPLGMTLVAVRRRRQEDPWPRHHRIVVGGDLPLADHCEHAAGQRRDAPLRQRRALGRSSRGQPSTTRRGRPSTRSARRRARLRRRGAAYLDVTDPTSAARAPALGRAQCSSRRTRPAVTPREGKLVRHFAGICAALSPARAHRLRRVRIRPLFRRLTPTSSRWRRRSAGSW